MWERRHAGGMKILTILLFCLVPISCRSGKATIGGSADVIAGLAADGRVAVANLKPLVPKDGEGFLAQVDNAFVGITKQATGVIKPALELVEDKPSGWIEGLKRWALRLGAVALLLVVLVYLGERSLIPGLGAVLAWLARSWGLTFTRKATDEAILAAKMKLAAEEDNPDRIVGAVNAYLAARQTVSPTFMGRYKRERDIIQRG